MRLESALNTGREGITAHGQAIAIVGDNISNANTVGYKNQRAVFADMLGDAPGERLSEVVAGGGDGVTVKEIRTNYEAGPIEMTGRDLDVALLGNGFFQVGDVANVQYTRNGAFTVNEKGLLVTSDGLPVLGYTGVDTVNLGQIDMTKVEVTVAPTTQIAFYGNLNSNSSSFDPPANPLTFKEINSAAAYTNVASVFDSLGNRHEILFAYYRSGANNWTVQAYVNGSEVGQAADQPVQVGTATLAFDASGRIPPESVGQALLNANVNWGNGAAASAIAVDISNFTQFAGSSIVNNVIQDGQGASDILGYEVYPDGGIFARMTDGARARIGSLSLASVMNEDGLVRSGSSTYAATERAGAIDVGLAGTGARSKVSPRSLEYSNVDLSGQFIELVVLQRAYAANSKVISTASEIIKDTISLVR